MYQYTKERKALTREIERICNAMRNTQDVKTAKKLAKRYKEYNNALAYYNKLANM